MTETPPDVLFLDSFATPIGEALVALDGEGALRAFNWRDYEGEMTAWLDRRYPRARRAGAATPAVRAAFGAYFAGDLQALEAIPRRAAGTEFQLRVWQALCGIPAGETISYAQLAARIGLALRSAGRGRLVA